MATIFRRGDTWRATIRIVGHASESRTFPTRVEARQWAQERDDAIRKGKTTGAGYATLADALRRYAREVSPKRKGARWEKFRLDALARDPVAEIRLNKLRDIDLIDWRDRRLQDVAPGTVYREMNLLGAVFTAARKEWRWIAESPMKDVTRPKEPPSRRRRIPQDEIDRICLALGYIWPALPKTASQRVALAFLFALETAMRAGEIEGLEPKTIHLAKRYVDLPKTKNGDARQVPLSLRAVEILKLLPANSVPAFGLKSTLRDALFRKAKAKAAVDFRFHDSRAEAIWRLSKKLDVLQLAGMIGHRDINSLRFYYAEHASETAMRLG